MRSLRARIGVCPSQPFLSGLFERIADYCTIKTETYPVYATIGVAQGPIGTGSFGLHCLDGRHVKPEETQRALRLGKGARDLPFESKSQGE